MNHNSLQNAKNCNSTCCNVLKNCKNTRNNPYAPCQIRKFHCMPLSLLINFFLFFFSLFSCISKNLLRLTEVGFLRNFVHLEVNISFIFKIHSKKSQISTTSLIILRFVRFFCFLGLGIFFLCFSKLACLFCLLKLKVLFLFEKWFNFMHFVLYFCIFV